MANKPKPAFFVIAAIVVIALVGYALYRFNTEPDTGGGGATTFTQDEMQAMKKGAEAPDATGITTVKEYEFEAGSRLPDVKGISAYTPLEDRTVQFAINVWAGWGPIILANGGFEAGKLWTTPSGEPFKVSLRLIDDPIQMRDAYAAGEVHIGWATLDMVPLFLEALRKDSRVMPRIYQQVDWSNGGDGIVVREAQAKTMADLRGKTVVLAQNSPSHFFLLNALVNAGVQPSEVEYKFTKDAFQAAAAFNADKSIAAVVSWAPDIYSLSEVRGNKLLVSTATANKLIADVWFARADFAKDHPDITEGLVRGIFDAMVELKTEAAREKVAELMSAGYSIPASECLAMLGDAHSTNYAENRDFFLNQNNPTNFESTWKAAYFYYKKIRAITGVPVPFDQVMDFSVIKKLASEDQYASQRNEYQFRFTPSASHDLNVEDVILTKTVVIHFFPNSWDLDKKIIKQVDGKDTEVAYDPNVGFVVDEIGTLAGQYGAARIVIEGHTDGSMRGRASAALVKELSARRAGAVKEAVVRKFPTLQPNQFSTSGVGWDRPAEVGNHAKNRRVEIKVYPAEAPNPK